MKTGYQRWPKVRGKGGHRLRAVVAVTLDDGSTLPVDLQDLRGYVRCMDDANRVEDLGGDAFAVLKHYVRKATLPAAKRANARKPRKAKRVTKAALMKSRAAFIARWGRERGWKTAAINEYGISLETLNKRMSA